MIFQELGLNGVYLVEPQLLRDERGFFARTYCEREFLEHNLNCKWAQCNVSFNKKRGTLRGMHYQVSPREEIKLIRCTRGAVYDVVIDIRPDSLTFCQWLAVELSEDNTKMLYVPQGFAHGFQTLKDDTELFYQMSQFFAPEYARGIRWDDELFKISWPVKEKIISDNDRKYQDYKP